MANMLIRSNIVAEGYANGCYIKSTVQTEITYAESFIRSISRNLEFTMRFLPTRFNFASTTLLKQQLSELDPMVVGGVPQIHAELL